MSRRNAWTVVLAVMALTALISLVTMPPADGAVARPERPPAPKSFAWSFEGECCVTSREWSTSVKAAIRVTSVLEPCKTKYGRVEYVIGLWRGGKLVSAKRVTCWGSPTWKAQPPGVYRFRLVILPPWRDSQVFEGYGTVYYDGAAK